MVKILLWSKVEILVWMSFDLNNLDANNSGKCILGNIISENYFSGDYG
ncbi:unnamed protein product [Brassica rapa]|uniref:Uncharacterized protein n=1 Tax=Brassica campestris TaxID=3711 RepID=A0A8D9G5M9_BRACM|nr:unnamed protein product [Brassica rapa]